jgi:hypothetical protein
LVQLGLINFNHWLRKIYRFYDSLSTHNHSLLFQSVSTLHHLQFQLNHFSPNLLLHSSTVRLILNFFLSHLDSGKIVVILNFYLRPIFFFRTLILFKILLSLLHVFLFKLISLHFKKKLWFLSQEGWREIHHREGGFLLCSLYIYFDLDFCLYK